MSAKKGVYEKFAANINIIFMKVLILAGGLGTRLSEETGIRPKPMVELGGKPILWHIMKMYSQCGFNDFVILTGYKSHMIKEFFIDYYHRYSDIVMDMRTNKVDVLQNRTEPWVVNMLYTGESTMTAGRIKKAQQYVKGETFLLTYGDGVSDVDINEVIKFHKSRKALVTLTAVKPGPRFGMLDIAEDGMINSFREKADVSWINGGFFVCEPEVFDYIGETDCMFERAPLEALAAAGKLAAYKHEGFWRPMDTLRDKLELNEMWASQEAPWATWLEKK